MWKPSVFYYKSEGPLESAVDEINSVWIEGFFPARIDDLNSKMSQDKICSEVYLPRSAATITYSKVYPQLTNLTGIMDPDLTVSGNWNSGGKPSQ